MKQKHTSGMSYWEDKVDPNAPKLTARLIRRLLTVIGEYKASVYAEHFRRECPACGQPKRRKKNYVYDYDVLCSKCKRRLPYRLSTRFKWEPDSLYPNLAEATLEAIKFIRANPQPQARRSGRKAVSA